ncbi:MAG: efflux RND transporter periplasmic adaptor subunit [Cytophagales bacterium]|nr:efflux RND transporter periplasmic adaptor subunit [Cytophagales bacterium]
MIHYYKLIKIYYLIILLLAAACIEDKKKPMNTAVTQKPIIKIKNEELNWLNISIESIKEKEIFPIIYASGIVAAKPNHDAVLISRVPGKIQNILKIEGQNVKKGEIIIEISSLELIKMQQDYLEAIVQMNFYKKDYDRQLSLRTANVGAVSEFQLTESKFLSAVSTEKTLRASLEMLGVNVNELQDPISATIKTTKSLPSPIDGFIYNMTAKIGQRTEQGTILANIVDLSELRAEIHCYEKDLELIEEGQEMEISFANKSIPSVKGVIEHISRSIDRETRAASMHCSFRPPAGYLVLPEMSITAKIQGTTSGKKAMVIPASAVYDESDQSFIYYTQNTATDTIIIFHKAKIKTGTSDGNYVELIPEEMVPKNARVATMNVANLEAEFKKREGI